MIRRSSLTVSGASCSSSEGKSSGWRPIQAPTYRFGGSVTLASRRSRKGELETCFEHSLNVLSHKAKPRPLWNRWFPSWLAILLFPYDDLHRNKAFSDQCYKLTISAGTRRLRIYAIWP